MTLVIPTTMRPTNLHLSPDQLHWDLDADTLGWLERLPEEVDGGERLFVLIQKDQERPFIIMERADNGVEMMVYRTDQLDARTYERLRYMRHVPLEKRLAALEREEAAWEAAGKQEQADELYETMGAPMYRQLHHDGFVRGERSESFPLRPRRRH